MGRGLARHLSKKNEVIIGSREPAKAREVAKDIAGATGEDYATACGLAEAALFAIPYSNIGVAAGLAKELSGKLAISLINPLRLQDGIFHYAPTKGSAAEELAGLLTESRVATAFNHVSHLFLKEERVVPMDILIAADSREIYREAAKLVEGVENMRPLYVGPLSQAGVVEAITPLVLNLAKLNGTGSLTTRFVTRKG
jgi:8-hydroxy-5-deazaflavin:NADPH oxidoreductase